MNKVLILILTVATFITLSAGCTNTVNTANNEHEITVISREEGSGTRGAFIELFEIEVENAEGEKVDMTTDDAEISNSTSVVMTSVAGNPYAIGYISMGSLNDTVKALSIDGASPTVDNINAGTYKIVRPFNIATSESVSESARTFIDFILSAEGQAVVVTSGYIASVQDAAPFTGSMVSGKVIVAGSSSVTPVMEKLKEAYEAINPNAEIEIQQSDSTTGMNSVIEGICDIGMASRELKDSEMKAGLTSVVIARDGIAVIVSNENPVNELTSEQVRAIYIGEITTWSDITG
jgi:phosphate transport system substrate-binding protein